MVPGVTCHGLLHLVDTTPFHCRCFHEVEIHSVITQAVLLRMFFSSSVMSGCLLLVSHIFLTKESL